MASFRFFFGGLAHADTEIAPPRLPLDAYQKLVSEQDVTPRMGKLMLKAIQANNYKEITGARG